MGGGRREGGREGGGRERRGREGREGVSWHWYHSDSATQSQIGVSAAREPENQAEPGII